MHNRRSFALVDRLKPVAKLSHLLLKKGAILQARQIETCLNRQKLSHAALHHSHRLYVILPIGDLRHVLLVLHQKHVQFLLRVLKLLMLVFLTLAKLIMHLLNPLVDQL